MSCTLCILFNHPYAENIPDLEEVYGNRFSHLRFVIPQRETTRADTLTVFRGSFTFQGMVVDAIPWLPQDSEWYAFIQDDAFIRPEVNEGNIGELLSLANADAFFPSFNTLNWTWWWLPRIVWKYFYPNNPLSGDGFEHLERFLPSREVAWAKAARFGFRPYALPKPRPEELSYLPLVGNTDCSAEVLYKLVCGIYATAREKSFVDINYPLVNGPSDFFMVHRSLLPRLRPILGAFAAAGMFAEVAIPTALLTEADQLVRADASGQRFEWALKLSDLIDAPDGALFPNSSFLIHPVKLGMLREAPDRYQAILDGLSGRRTQRSGEAIPALASGFPARG